MIGSEGSCGGEEAGNLSFEASTLKIKLSHHLASLHHLRSEQGERVGRKVWVAGRK